MKKFSMMSFTVFILLVINLILVYFLLFNTSLLNRWLNQFEGETVITTTTSDPIVEVDDHYTLTEPTMDQVITPYKMIINEADAIYDVNNYDTLQAVMALLNQQAIEITSNNVETNPEMYQEAIAGDYLQLLYPTKYSVLSLRSILKIPEDVSTQFELSRIVIPRDRSDIVYLVDTSNFSYITAQFTDNLLASQILSVVDSVRNEQWLPVTHYELGMGSVYLPNFETIASSQIYTLDKMPDGLFLDDVFPNNNYDISELDANSVRSYHTLLTSFQINDLTNIMTVNHSISANQGSNSINREFILPEEKVRYSFPYVQTFEYWPGDIRLYSESNNTVTYRRFLNGLPIYSAPNLADYGATRVTLRTSPNIEVYRYQMPLVTIGTHIHDLSRVYDIESGQQIEALLTEQGLSFANFTNIVLGYEWQVEMENFKTVTLVPKWFFHINSNYYSIDQVRDGTLSELTKQVNTSDNSVDDVMSVIPLTPQAMTETSLLAPVLAGLTSMIKPPGHSDSLELDRLYLPRSTRWNSLVNAPAKSGSQTKLAAGTGSRLNKQSVLSRQVKPMTTQTDTHTHYQAINSMGKPLSLARGGGQGGF